MTILTPKEVSALLKDINFDSQQANSQQAKTSLSDFQQARAERNFLNVYSQEPQKAILQKTDKTASPTKPFIPPQFKPKTTPQQTKIFEIIVNILLGVVGKVLAVLI